MDAFGYIVLAVLAVGALGGLWAARNPVEWDEVGGEGPQPPPAAAPPVDDAAELRALIAAKRAARAARGGEPTAGDRTRAAEAQAAADAAASGIPWAHLEDDVVEEARGLVARRQARLERQGKPAPEAHDELVRLLGPPHA